jgi:hypothetical protein
MRLGIFSFYIYEKNEKNTWNFPVLVAFFTPSLAASVRTVDDASSNSRESICTDDPTKLASVAATS